MSVFLVKWCNFEKVGVGHAVVRGDVNGVFETARFD